MPLKNILLCRTGEQRDIRAKYSKTIILGYFECAWDRMDQQSIKTVALIEIETRPQISELIEFLDTHGADYDILIVRPRHDDEREVSHSVLCLDDIGAVLWTLNT